MSLPHHKVPWSNTYWVIPGVLLAGEHPTDLDDDLTRRKLSDLLDAGIRLFVDLTEVQETGSYQGLLDTLGQARDLDVTFLRIPIPDRSVPSPATLADVLDALDRSAKENRPAYVHCFAGIGRTGTIVGCFLRRRGLVAPGNVAARIAVLRRRMPIGNQPSPHTPAQIRMIENWKDGQ